MRRTSGPAKGRGLAAGRIDSARGCAVKTGVPAGRKPRGADIDTLTPIEAMNLLYELKKML